MGWVGEVTSPKHTNDLTQNTYTHAAHTYPYLLAILLNSYHPFHLLSRSRFIQEATPIFPSPDSLGFPTRHDSDRCVQSRIPDLLRCDR